MRLSTETTMLAANAKWPPKLLPWDSHVRAETDIQYPPQRNNLSDLVAYSLGQRL